MFKRNKMGEHTTINCLPNEIIALILQKLNSRAILRFGATCARFNDIVKSNQYLWKDIAKRSMPEYLYNIIQEYSEGDWLHELKSYNTVKQEIFAELIGMSPRYYKQENEINVQDVRPIFKTALSSQFSYNQAIYTIQEQIRTGDALLDTCKNVVKPYTMTELHYAKIVLRHLVHTFLCLKWVRAHLCNELPPEIVCNYFIQWIDTFSIHHDECVDEKINELVNEVKAILHENKDNANASVDGPDGKKEVTDQQVLSAVTQVVYLKRNMAVTNAANIETLDIIKILQKNCGNIIILTALYQAVAKRCGVTCELIAFPNHLFLEWRDHSDPQNLQVFTVDPSTGTLSRRRRCPYSQNGPATKYRYSPDSLLQYICSSFHMSMGTIRNWNTHNALHLLDFLGTNLNVQNSYRHCLPSLIADVDPSGKTTPVDLKHMLPAHVEVIASLSEIDIPCHESRKRYFVKRRTGDVKYCVGMQCFHNKYEYACVVRDWEAHCALKFQAQMIAENLYGGVGQPFYHVIAADQSERYVPQENLDRLPRPFRMHLVEEVIAPEFSHFDGFAYVGNDMKRAEYPDDEAALDAYRARAVPVFNNILSKREYCGDVLPPECSTSANRKQFLTCLSKLD